MTKIYGEKQPHQTYIKRHGVYGITFDSNQRVALVKVPFGYLLPGGGIDPGEDHVTCLTREFLEETGYDVTIGPLIETSSQYTYSENNKRYYELIGHFYVTTLNGNPTTSHEPDHELVWHSVDEAVALLYLEYQAEAVKVHSSNLMRLNL